MQRTPDDALSPQASASTNSAIRASDFPDEECQETAAVSSPDADTQIADSRKVPGGKSGCTDSMRRGKLTNHPLMRLVARQAEELTAALPKCCDGKNYTYLVSGGGLVKIGKTTDPRQRILALQVSSPVPLTMRVLSRDESFEQYLHVMLSDHRRHGEWFDEAGVFSAIHINIARSRALNECLRCSTLLGKVNSFRRQQRAALEAFDQTRKDKAMTSHLPPASVTR